MIVDMRYHLASLVAVFLALGLGILIGVTINSDGRLVNEQASLIDAIDVQLQQLRAEKSALVTSAQEAASEVTFYKKFVDALLPSLVDGRLEGARVRVLGIGARSLTKSVEDVLIKSGAEVTVSVLNSEVELLSVAQDLKGKTPECVVLVGDSPVTLLIQQAAEDLRKLGVTVFAAGADQWLQLLQEAGASPVERAETAVGQVALIRKIEEIISATP